MGRTGAAQRSKKAEKAKVKLKSHATKFLPKGKNITDTTFKVRKIIIQEQLKTLDGSQPLTKKKLNIKVLLIYRIFRKTWVHAGCLISLLIAYFCFLFL